jgi:HPr kinase/phosphorylase
MIIKVKNLIEDLKLEILVQGEEDSLIYHSDINRPGLQFAGFYNYFANSRVQIVGMAEWSYIEDMSSELRIERLSEFFQFKTPCVIMSRGLEPQKELIECAKANKRWLLRTNTISTGLISKLMNYIDDKLAPETRLHGVLMDVYGIGILITGESGVGKSETALELIKRGHRLVADDAVEIREIQGILKGEAPYITHGMIEVRGLGIMDITSLYGLSSVLNSKTVHLMIALEQWKEENEQGYDRLGIDDKYVEILNVPVRKIILPIRPGRNLAVIIEAAAANYRYSVNSKITPVDVINKRIFEGALNEN